MGPEIQVVPLTTAFRLRPIHEEVGFDYVAALRRIKTRLTYEEIAYATGYESNGGVSRIIDGAVPSHVQGEAIWALYVELFGERPPYSSAVADAMLTT